LIILDRLDWLLVDFCLGNVKIYAYHIVFIRNVERYYAYHCHIDVFRYGIS